VGESEQLLARVVRLEFTVVDGELLFEVLQLVQGLAGGEISLHGAILFKVLSEHLHLNHEGVDVLDQLLLELRLVVVQVVTDDESLLDQLVPLLLEVLALVHLVAVHIEGILNEGVHVGDRFELEVNVGLLLADLLESEHNRS
jgi:hypothetical protein